jgi:hypothetical protein
MITQSTNAYKYIKVSCIINTVFLLRVLDTLVAVLREAHYKGWIYLDTTKVSKPMHRHNILSFKNI